MSSQPPEKRRSGRIPIELPLVLRDASGHLLDEDAKALDLTAEGFRAQTRRRLRPDDRVTFVIALEEGEVRGQAEVIWSAHDQWGWFSAGMRITKLPWGERGRLKRVMVEPGYDFGRLARRALWALFWAVIVVGAHNLAFNQPVLGRVALDLIPVILALAVLGWSLHALLIRRD